MKKLRMQKLKLENQQKLPRPLQHQPAESCRAGRSWWLRMVEVIKLWPLEPAPSAPPPTMWLTLKLLLLGVSFLKEIVKQEDDWMDCDFWKSIGIVKHFRWNFSGTMGPSQWQWSSLHEDIFVYCIRSKGIYKLVFQWVDTLRRTIWRGIQSLHAVACMTIMGNRQKSK